MISLSFAIATWRGDAQRYWLTQVLDLARSRHDQWLQSNPAQRATLEPAYILGDRKHIPEAPNAVESVLRMCIQGPRTIVAFVNEILSGITQYYRTVGSV